MNHPISSMEFDFDSVVNTGRAVQTEAVTDLNYVHPSVSSAELSEVLRLRAVSSLTGDAAKPSSGAAVLGRRLVRLLSRDDPYDNRTNGGKWGPDPHFYEKIAHQKAHFSGPNANLPYVSPIFELPSHAHTSREKSRIAARLSKTTGFLLSKTVELSKRRSVRIASCVGAYLLASGVALFAISGIGSDSSPNSGSRKQTAKPAAEQPTIISGASNMPDTFNAATGSPVTDTPDHDSAMSLNQSEVSIAEGGNLSWSVSDWLRNQGATDEEAIEEQTSNIVRSIAERDPQLNIHVVFEGQRIDLPQEVASQALANILAAQAA